MATVCSRRLFSAASQRRCSGQVTHFEDHGLVYHNGTGAAMTAGGFESRFHMAVGESEASLLGVVYTEEGVMTAAPYKVVEPEHCEDLARMFDADGNGVLDRREFCDFAIFVFAVK